MYTLITGANSSQAYKLKASLNSEHILLGDYLELPELLLRSGMAIRLPDPQTASYNHQMLTLCLDKDIRMIYALRSEEIQVLSSSKQLFLEYNIDIKAADEI